MTRKFRRQHARNKHKLPRDLVVQEARELVGRVLAVSGYADVSPHTCLQHSMSLAEVLLARGINVIPQAGSAQWLRVDVDDGISPTHFTYQWVAGEAKRRWLQGLMPEMHVWVALDTQEIVDITTRYLPEICRSLIGLDWRGPKPDYLWVTRNTYEYQYQANIDACLAMNAMMFQLYEEHAELRTLLPRLFRFLREYNERG